MNLNYDKFSVFGSVGKSGGSLDFGYENWIAGTSFGSGSGSVGASQGLFIGNSAFGTVGMSHSDIISRDHSIWSLNGNLFGLTGSLDFQHGDLKHASVLGFDKQFEDWDWTCFEKDAKINTKFGIKNIQDIKVGDSVLSFNEESHKFEYKKVLRLFEREIEKVIHIKLSNGQIMKVTEGHRIWVNSDWTLAKEIKLGDKLLDSDRKEVLVENIEVLNKSTKVYNFEVQDNHNYVAYGVLVHNKCVQESDGKRKNVANNYTLKHGEKWFIRPDEDGYLTFAEAKQWWKDGNGEPLYLDLSRVDLSKITPKDFDNKVGNEASLNLLQEKFHNLNDGVVHGNITLKYLGGNQVSVVGHDTYNFEMHEIRNWRDAGGTFHTILRNTETSAALKIHGEGKKFDIYFYGVGRIGK